MRIVIIIICYILTASSLYAAVNELLYIQDDRVSHAFSAQFIQELLNAYVGI